VRIFFVLVILALAVTMVNRVGIDQVSEPGPVISAGDTARLRGCAPMRAGDPRGDCVRWLQEVLRARGSAIQSTGSYHDLTTTAVMQFQQARGLPRKDGAADEATLFALTELPLGGDEWDLRRECVSLSRNKNGTQGGADSEGSCVVALRNRLNDHGAALPSGDRFDERTDVAVRAFQISVGLDALGIVGPQTKDALYGAQPPGGESSIVLKCEAAGCAMYLTRRMTKGLASASKKDPAQYAITGALTVLACRRVKALSMDIVCQTAASYLVDTLIDVTAVADKAQQAGKRNACLVVNLGYPSSSTSWSPLSLAVNGGPNCHY
jgi:peptidoglycan hydrolase-like protein with peptidoglycan-binding domain